MDVEVMARAVGQSAGVIVFWDDNPDIGMAWPRAVQMIPEVQWGTGTLDGADCLVLYLFAGDQSLELYVPETLPTTPALWLDVWELLITREPDILKIRYGGSPADGNREVTFLLPKETGESPMDKLRLFAQKADQWPEADSLRGLHGKLLERLQVLSPVEVLPS
jgi:hypothetical protein